MVLQGLKVHKHVKGHFDEKTRAVTKTVMEDARLQKRKEAQRQLPHVKWGDQEAQNAWHSKYLDSILEAGGGQKLDIKTRIVMARQRFGKLRHAYMGG